MRPAVGLFLAAFALYARSIGFGFVRADDIDLIAGNAAFLSDFSNLPRAFVRSFFESQNVLADLATYYRPLAIASFMLDTHLGGSDPAVYHFVNLVLHGAVATLLLWVLRLLSASSFAPRGASTTTALMLPLLFVVHPANVSSVCWVMGRNELLLGAFSLAALASFITYWRHRSRRALAVHVVMFAGALFSKESGLALLPLIVLYPFLWEPEEVRLKPDATTVGHSSSVASGFSRTSDVVSGFSRTPSTPLRLAVTTGLDLLVVILWWRLRTIALAGGSSTPQESWWRTLVANAPQLLVYFEKIPFPFRLTPMPGFDTTAIAVGLIAGGMLIVSMMAMLGVRRFCFVAAWFVAFLVPSLLVPGLPAYEHRLYVPLLGIAFGFSALKLDAGSWRRYVAGVLIVLFAVLSFRYAATFRDPLTYWTRATESASYAPIAQVNVGQILQEMGHARDAEAHFRRALELDPRTPKAHNNLGVALMDLGRTEEAKLAFMRELALHPTNAEAHYNLGLYFKLEGKMAEAVPHWEEAIRLNRYYLPAYEQLSSYYASRGDDARVRWYADELRALRGR